MASHASREPEQLGFKWEIDVACKDFGAPGEDPPALSLSGQAVHYQLGRRGQTLISLNSVDDEDSFTVVGNEADGQIRITVSVADQTAASLVGGLVYEERIWTKAGSADPVDQHVGFLHVRA